MRGTGFVRRARGGFSPLSQLAQRLGRTGGQPKFAGVRLSSPDLPSAWGISKQIANGEYDFPGFRPQSGDRIVDVGANIGVYALWAARLGATVTAYEPNPETFGHLTSNTAGRSVRPVQAAVVGQVTTTGTVRLYLHDASSTRNTLSGREIGSGIPLERSVQVPAIGINEVLAEPCDLLKVDCEGGEFEIFDLANDQELRQARGIIVEFHRLIGDPVVLVDRLATAGFGVRILDGVDPGSSFGLIGALRR